MALSHGLHQKLLQKLSPQQIQLMKLIQLPTAVLEERIKEELEENPALETGEDKNNAEEIENNNEDDLDLNPEEDFEPDGSKDEYENIDITEYVQDGDDEIADYKLREEISPELESKEIPYKIETGFNELMLEQLGMLNLNERDQKIAEQIIGNLDDDGYLRREIPAITDDLAFRQNIQVTNKEVEKILFKIQQFDPAGVGARNLQECLLLQLKRKPDENPYIEIAIKIIEKQFNEFIKKHYEKIQQRMNLSGKELKDILQIILKLNPKPAGNMGESNTAESYIIPDFFIINNNGLLELTLNSKNAPDLRISEGYRSMLKDYEKGSKKDKRQREAVLFIKQKIDSAKWFIDAIKQRQQTLISTMTAIMNYQHDFFITGDETDLKPMILKDISGKTGLDISTISRVANSKFVQTEFGSFRLKYFFSESLQTDSGEEVSTTEVKKMLSNLIEEESKKQPLSDEELTDLLQKKGYNIARRTVAKYREQLNIPVARLRKKL